MMAITVSLTGEHIGEAETVQEAIRIIKDCGERFFWYDIGDNIEFCNSNNGYEQLLNTDMLVYNIR